MPNNHIVSVLHELNRSVAPAGSDELGDAELLERFARRRDQAAFELLVWRHGPMVFGLCQRLLRHEQDAEDALQATFLVLVRKASTISKKESLASWLYKVAYRIACRARARTPVLSNQSAIMEAKDSPDEDAIWRDLREKLDQEVAQLPENYRRPIVLCYLEGKTHEEAARLLGCPKGTLASNLARARDRLHRRLTRRGWALSSAVLATVLGDKARAGVLAPELVQQTVRSALAFDAGQAAGFVSANTIALAEGVLRLMWYAKLKMVAGLFLAFVLCAGGIGLVIRQAWAGDGGEDAQAAPLLAHQDAGGPQAEGQADAKKEIAVLRGEIADLRKELAAALKEIKVLKDFLRQTAVPPVEKEPLYRAKPASFWLEQFKDADPAFRLEAVKALRNLAPKKPEVISTLVEALRDAEVGHEAVSALVDANALGLKVVPSLLEILDEKNLPSARSFAADALGQIGNKEAIPFLTKALSAEDWTLRGYAVIALERHGRKAASAVPAIVSVLEDYVTLAEKPRKNITTAQMLSNPGAYAAVMVRALLSIEPDIAQILPKEVRGPDFSAEPATWRQACEKLRKKYPKQK